MSLFWNSCNFGHNTLLWMTRAQGFVSLLKNEFEIQNQNHFVLFSWNPVRRMQPFADNSEIHISLENNYASIRAKCLRGGERLVLVAPSLVEPRRGRQNLHKKKPGHRGRVAAETLKRSCTVDGMMDPYGSWLSTGHSRPYKKKAQIEKSTQLHFK